MNVKKQNARCCSIVPPHLLRRLAQCDVNELKTCAQQTLEHTERLRGQRDILGAMHISTLVKALGGKQRAVYDLKHRTQLPGHLVRSEGGHETTNIGANEAYDYSGLTYDFYYAILNRNSVDDQGMRLDSSVHYSRNYDNAFWNGAQMVYGDGDGVIFNRFTISLDVIGHELTHGVTQNEAALEYHDQPGALNESFSDVFGVLIKQWYRKQSVEEADWLVGAGLFTADVKGVALRSLKAPGTAYDDPRLGKDPQPAHMRDYYRGEDDNGGVHINSGIPNHAFYLAAVAMGGFAWEKAGKIWYDALIHRLRPASDFAAAAKATLDAAGALYGNAGKEQSAVRAAWQQVGVLG